jgi:CTP:molybdopterin cytidylyltransferase MocA
MRSTNDTTPLCQTVEIGPHKILGPGVSMGEGEIRSAAPALIVLAAGKGTRFGQAPKCAQPVCGVPLARHSMNAFRSFRPSPVICLVGYRHEEVAAALGEDNIYVKSENPTAGTAFAAYEAFSVSQLEERDPVVIISMGDRVVTESAFRRLYETHTMGTREADLTLLSALYEPPKNRGIGRIVRDAQRRVLEIVEQRDIDALEDGARRRQLADTREGNCSLYAMRASRLRHYLSRVTRDNAQQQYHFTDIVRAIRRDGGDIRTVTTSISDPDYDLLCSDVTRPMDLALLESLMTASEPPPTPILAGEAEIEHVANQILETRPLGQVAAIAAQLEELIQAATNEDLGFQPDQPIGIGFSGGRVRIAFMHPDMGRFFGPAWQMPFGARDAVGREQIVVLIQNSEDGKIHLFPTDARFREKLNALPADNEFMYPGEEIADWYSYEGFGTRMAENLLLSLGYFTEAELEARKKQNLPLPPPSLWINNSMRRPFSLIGNAIASIRTLRAGNLGARVQTYLGRDGFRGLRVMSTGNIPQGGFSSSSAVTVASKNAINALYDLGISPDMLVHLACQAEYGTGVRAGALDQATEQKGQVGQGTLISSNPRENYRIIGTYPVPADRFHVIFAYSVDRDRVAWKWSAGVYAGACEPGRLTASEMRKMTGKSSELAAILTRLPLDRDFFQEMEEDLVSQGVLQEDTLKWVYDVLRQLPLCVTQAGLRNQLWKNRPWYIEQLMEYQRLSVEQASEKADATLEALFSGWRDPTLQRADATGKTVRETGIPLRAMVGYLFGEVAKNFYLIHHTDQWIEYVTRSQWGDRCVEIDPEVLPSADEMLGSMPWEAGAGGPDLLERWLKRFGAKPFDYNRGLDNQSLATTTPQPLHEIQGTSFFRGLALVDLAEAMLKRAFGQDTVAVRINAAGQGDYFQVHIDTTQAEVDHVKDFIRKAFYGRFGLQVKQEFVEPHPGGGAAGVRLSRFDQLPELIRELWARTHPDSPSQHDPEQETWSFTSNPARLDAHHPTASPWHSSRRATPDSQLRLF